MEEKQRMGQLIFLAERYQKGRLFYETGESKATFPKFIVIPGDILSLFFLRI